MRHVLRDAMCQRAGSSEDGEHLSVRSDKVDVLCVPAAFPAALTVSAAREIVGQPFLRDHEFSSVLSRGEGKRGGPVHVIACHKTATDAQATRLLGLADTTVVSAPFGVYVADAVQKV